MINYYHKYIKYKTKYLKQLGGNGIIQQLNELWNKVYLDAKNSSNLLDDIEKIILEEKNNVNVSEMKDPDNKSTGNHFLIFLLHGSYVFNNRKLRQQLINNIISKSDLTKIITQSSCYNPPFYKGDTVLAVIASCIGNIRYSWEDNNFLYDIVKKELDKNLDFYLTYKNSRGLTLLNMVLKNTIKLGPFMKLLSNSESPILKEYQQKFKENNTNCSNIYSNKKIEIRNELGSGNNSIVYLVCKNNKCDYVAKIPKCIKTGMDELEDLNFLSDEKLEFAVNIVDQFLCDEEEQTKLVIIEEKLDGTLSDLIDKYAGKKNGLGEIPKNKVLELFENIGYTLKDIQDKLKKIGFVYNANELHIENIMYLYDKNEKKFIIKLPDLGGSSKKNDKNDYKETDYLITDLYINHNTSDERKQIPYEEKFLEFIKKIKNDTDMEPQIKSYIAAGYTFTPVGMSEVDMRQFIKVSVNDKYIIAYRSNSEEGMWRLCAYDGGTYFHKGCDYIASSLIHYDLQKIMNDAYYLLEKFDIKKGTYCNYNDYPTKKIINYLDNKNRLHNNPIFYPIQICASGKCFLSESPLEQYKNNLKKNKDKYHEDMLNFFNNGNNLSKTEQITKIKKIISLYLEKYFDNDGTCEHIYDYFFSYKSIRFDYAIYKTIIKNKENNYDKYIIYFQKVEYTNKENKSYNGTYYLPLIVVPHTATVNEFGLYNEYVDVGIYNHKILEYTDQCSLDDPTRNVYEYTFMGDLLTNMWPLNKIKY